MPSTGDNPIFSTTTEDSFMFSPQYSSCIYSFAFEGLRFDVGLDVSTISSRASRNGPPPSRSTLTRCPISIQDFFHQFRCSAADVLCVFRWDGISGARLTGRSRGIPPSTQPIHTPPRIKEFTGQFYEIFPPTPNRCESLSSLCNTFKIAQS